MSQDRKPIVSVEFSPDVLDVSAPAILKHLDWLQDDDFVSALQVSWQSQYADYIGQVAAENLVSRLCASGEILTHEPANTLIAVVDGKKAGIAAIRHLQGLSLITMLEVLEDYRGRGVGKQLVSALATINEPLLAHVSIHRPHVKAFYAAMGFQALEQTCIDHFGYSLSFHVMARSAQAARFSNL